MGRARSTIVTMPVLWLLAVLLAGCAGSGRVVELDVKAAPPADAGMRSADQPRQLTVVVKPFDDARPERDSLGIRTHLGGGVTRFELKEGPATSLVARVVAEHLARRGWQAAVGEPGGQPDVVMSGTLHEFSVHAKSRFGSTLLRASLRLALRAENTADGSMTTMMLEDSREDTEFWFDAEDLEELVNEMLDESVRNMVASVQVADGALRLK